ncbi:MAG: SusD/RagB family nutrient-binding outer membrane lipoprotein, partial [Spirosomaceae bacterium]|nr:SusD/RagB family nutrient-binding outer membrane lipoprotein [Spirosomataceae bacterium]
NPNAFTDAPGGLIIGQAGFASILLSESQPARFAGIFTDQFTGADRQFISYESYQVTAGDFDDAWGNIYTAGLAQTKLVQEKARETGNPGLEGVSQIIEGWLVGEGAALFGDIPYSQAIQPNEFPNPKYDTQQEVFAAVQSLLSDAITNVQTGSAVSMPMYSGSYSWAEVAHTLKARYYLIAKDYANAASEAAQGISAPNKTLSAFHSSTIGQQNLYYQFGVLERGGYLTVIRSTLRKMLQGEQARLLPTPGDAARAAKYFDGEELNYTANGYFAIDADFPLISWEENQLILAEALARTGNEAGARTAFNAVRTNLATTYAASFPATTATGTTLINQILEEKYCTLIGSFQVFHDLRRTKNALGIPVKNSTASSIPQRFLYAQNEINTNTSFPGIVDIYTPTPVNQ